MRGDNLPIVELRNSNTEGKEAHYVQINQLFGITKGNNVTEKIINRAEMDFMLDLKSMTAKSATDAELNRVKLPLNREDCTMAPKQYRQQFEKLSVKWELTLLNDKIIVPNECRKRLLDMLHLGHAGTIIMTGEAKFFDGQTSTEILKIKSKTA